MILVHNHPSGDLTPSRADMDFTDRILKVGEILSIEVLDHIIISETAYESFSQIGLMDKLKKSNTWRLIPQEEEEVRQIKENILKEKSKNEGKLEVAKKLKLFGFDDLIIKKSTGLGIREIKKL